MDEKQKYAEFRHSWWTRFLRRYLYYLIVDRKSWPITFTPPDRDDCYASLDSPNLYIHLPFCRKICSYCPYVKFPFTVEHEQKYALSLVKEIADFTNIGEIKPIESLYFGGGTPSLSPSIVERVINLLRPHFADGVEVAIELHPSDCSAILLRELREIGINKVSIGVESFSQKVLNTLGREYSPDDAKRAIVYAKREGFDCVDINLLYSIPQQSIEDAVSDVSTAISHGADHISAYPLFAFRHTASGRSLKSGPEGMAAIRARIKIQKSISRLCLKHGYKRTSVWSFTRPGVSPYTTVTRDSYRGFGVGAGSKINDNFWFNTFSLDNYLQAESVAPALVMHSGDRFQRFHWLYWRIYRTDIDPVEYHSLYGRDLERDFQLVFLIMRLFGWINRFGEGWQLTERGAVFAHLLQSLFSLSYIDILWTRCQAEPCPQEVVFE